jgi:predicted PurR-regulated permease PerM
MNEPETGHSPERVADDWRSPSHMQAIVLIVATALGIFVCYRLAVPFLPALAWALALAILFTPLNRWIESKMAHPSVAAAISVVVVALIVAAPATFVGQRLVAESARGAEMIKLKVESGEWRRAIEAQPRLAPIAGWFERQLDLQGTVSALAAWLTGAAGAIVKGSVVQVIGFCLVFYLLFYFLRDRRLALQAVRALSPLSPADMEKLFSRVADTVYATVYGTLAVSAVQGLLGGLMFWWLGLPAPLLWGVVMALLAVVPVLGAFVVWIPAALFLALEGSWGKALILTLWGAVVVGGIDNLLRPVLVGNRLKLHTLLVFISVVGGLILFGPAGLILGPVALTVTTVLLETWRPRTAGSPASDAWSETSTPAAEKRPA